MYLGDAISNISGSFSCQDVDHAGVYLVSNVLGFHGFKYLYWIDVQQCRNLIVVVILEARISILAILLLFSFKLRK